MAPQGAISISVSEDSSPGLRVSRHVGEKSHRNGWLGMRMGERQCRRAMGPDGRSSMTYSGWFSQKKRSFWSSLATR